MVMRTMVAGFAFVEETVLLVCKATPEWQLGLWNGVGGKAEEYEAPIHAMVREFREEVGVETDQKDWTHFCTDMGRDYVVHFYKTRLVREFGVALPSYNDAGEALMFAPLDRLDVMPVVGNLRWLVPLAMDWRRSANPVLFQTQDDIRKNPSW